MDDAGFVAAVGDELPRVQRIARLLVPDPAAAEDLVAEAVARSLPAWRAGRVRDPGPYLRRAVVNLTRRRWRRARLARERDGRAAEWHRPARDDERDVVERDRTLRAVRELPPRRRVIVVLRFYDDLAEADIARTLGISVGTVKSQLSKALGQLRTELGDLDG